MKIKTGLKAGDGAWADRDQNDDYEWQGPKLEDAASGPTIAPRCPEDASQWLCDVVEVHNRFFEWLFN